jgi:hypothetical protein
MWSEALPFTNAIQSNSSYGQLSLHYATIIIGFFIIKMLVDCQFTYNIHYG